MKKLLALLVFFCSVSVFAQDYIVKKDGSMIACRVVELNASTIIYKKWSDLNGDDYVINRSDASAINYENGKKEDLGEATNQYAPNNQNDGVQQLNDVALIKIDAASRTSPKVTKKAKQFRIIGIVGAVMTGIGILAIINTSNGPDDSDTYDEEMAAGGALCVIGTIATATGFIVAHNYQKKAKQLQALSLYQQEFKFKNGTSLNPSVDLLKDQALNYQTIGLGLRYNF